MTSIGECLRRERLRRNLQLEQVSSELKISARMLAAIEAEDFEKLPGGVFAKSFVRQYAHLLGLDEEEMAAEVDRMLRPEQPTVSQSANTGAIPLPRMEAWQSVSDSRGWNSGWSAWLPALMMVVAVMLVCSGVYAFLQRPRPSVAKNQTAAVAHPQPAPPATPANAPATPAEVAAAPAATSQPPGATAEPGTIPEPKVVAEKAPATSAVPAPPPESTPAVSATTPGPVHVEITAIEPVWVRATSDGKYIFSGTIEANQTRVVDGSETVLLRLGNAGGVNITLNGKPIGEVGPKGQIRNIQLTPGGFQIVAAPKSPVDPL